jgi:glycosyltransferase involved in cell wall biosynthesis
MSNLSAKKKPRVLVFHSALAPYRVDIFNALSKLSELELVLLTRNNANQNFNQSELVSRLNIKPAYIDRKISVLNRDFPIGLAKVIDELSPNIVITDEFSVASFMVAVHKFKSKDKFCHIIWTDDNQELVKLDGIPRRVARRLLAPLVEGWLFISTEMQRYYEDVFGITRPSAIVPVTHDEDSFRKQLVKSKPFLKKIVEEYNLEGKRILLFVGRIVALKGIDRLLHAFANVVPQIDNAMLIIVGEGEERASLEVLTSDLGINPHVKFVGRFEGVELLAWYRVGQIFVLASNFEPFGAVVNEALIAGLPSIVSSFAGARSLIDEGVNGSIVHPQNLDQFTQVLITWFERTTPFVLEGTIRPNLMNSKFCDVTISVSNLFNTLLPTDENYYI